MDSVKYMEVNEVGRRQSCSPFERGMARMFLGFLLCLLLAGGILAYANITSH